MMKSRRYVFRASLAALVAGLSRGVRHARGQTNPAIVMTVNGPIAPEAMGLSLPHEHILVDFIGAQAVNPDRYSADEVVQVVTPHLERVKAQGVQTIVECTPAYLARDPALLKRLSGSTGLNLLTPTGYYGANGGKHLPAHAHTESMAELADRWLAEWREGIDATGIRPGFIKLGADAGPLSAVHRKLVQAAGIVHLASGLPIAAHSGDGVAALETMALLQSSGVAPSALIWVHAGSEPDPGLHTRAAAAGAWVEFDGLGPDSVEKHVGLVRAMKAAGHLDRVLISHDAGWYHVGEPGGGTFRPFDTLVSRFLPALTEAGLAPADVRRLTVDNPREAFTVRVQAVR